MLIDSIEIRKINSDWDTGRVHKQVELSKLVEDVGDEAIYVFGPGYVGAHRVCESAFFSNTLHRLRRLRSGVREVHRNRSAATREGQVTPRPSPVPPPVTNATPIG